MLSCGRPDTLWRCLDSLVPIREAVPSELIIVDTGCPVDIRERMAQYTDIIIPFTWCDDFSAARNAGLDAACGEWFMYIDDDEYFSDVRDIVTFFTSGRYRDYHKACYIQRNHHDAAGRTWRDAWAGRMISMEPRPVFKGRIHEYLSSPAGDGGGILLHSVAEHYGYVYETPEARQAHFLRNSTILLHMLAEDPGDGRSRMQLIYEYLGMEDATSALSQCREGLAAIEARSENDSVTAGFFRVMEGHALRLLGQEREALSAVQSAMAGHPGPYITARLCIHGAALAYCLEDATMAREYCTRYLSIYDDIGNDATLVYELGGRTMGDCFTVDDRDSIYELRIAADLDILSEKGDTAELSELRLLFDEYLADVKALRALSPAITDTTGTAAPAGHYALSTPLSELMHACDERDAAALKPLISVTAGAYPPAAHAILRFVRLSTSKW